MDNTRTEISFKNLSRCTAYVVTSAALVLVLYIFQSYNITYAIIDITIILSMLSCVLTVVQSGIAWSKVKPNKRFILIAISCIAIILLLYPIFILFRIDLF